jgi:hypothetical protein
MKKYTDSSFRPDTAIETDPRRVSSFDLVRITINRSLQIDKCRHEDWEASVQGRVRFDPQRNIIRFFNSRNTHEALGYTAQSIVEFSKELCLLNLFTAINFYRIKIKMKSSIAPLSMQSIVEVKQR